MANAMLAEARAWMWESRETLCALGGGDTIATNPYPVDVFFLDLGDDYLADFGDDEAVRS
jgi:hypothetical protein